MKKLTTLFCAAVLIGGAAQAKITKITCPDLESGTYPFKTSGWEGHLTTSQVQEMHFDGKTVVKCEYIRRYTSKNPIDTAYLSKNFNLAGKGCSFKGGTTMTAYHCEGKGCHLICRN